MTADLRCITRTEMRLAADHLAADFPLAALLLREIALSSHNDTDVCTVDYHGLTEPTITLRWLPAAVAVTLP